MPKLHEITVQGARWMNPSFWEWECSCGAECKYPHQTLTGAKISWKAHLRKVNRDAQNNSQDR